MHLGWSGTPRLPGCPPTLSGAILLFVAMGCSSGFNIEHLGDAVQGFTDIFCHACIAKAGEQHQDEGVAYSFVCRKPVVPILKLSFAI